MVLRKMCGKNSVGHSQKKIVANSMLRTKKIVGNSIGWWD